MAHSLRCCVGDTEVVENGKMLHLLTGVSVPIKNYAEIAGNPPNFAFGPLPSFSVQSTTSVTLRDSKNMDSARKFVGWCAKILHQFRMTIIALNGNIDEIKKTVDELHNSAKNMIKKLGLPVEVYMTFMMFSGDVIKQPDPTLREVMFAVLKSQIMKYVLASDKKAIKAAQAEILDKAKN
jgi:transcriptional regulator of met regulon